MSKRKTRDELARFKSVKRFEVRVAEEAIPEAEKVGKAHPHAVVVSENLVIRLVAHYRLEAICMIVHIEAAKSR